MSCDLTTGAPRLSLLTKIPEKINVANTRDVSTQYIVTRRRGTYLALQPGFMTSESTGFMTSESTEVARHADAGKLYFLDNPRDANTGGTNYELGNI